MISQNDEHAIKDDVLHILADLFLVFGQTPVDDTHTRIVKIFQQGRLLAAIGLERARFFTITQFVYESDPFTMHERIFVRRLKRGRGNSSHLANHSSKTQSIRFADAVQDRLGSRCLPRPCRVLPSDPYVFLFDDDT